MSLCAIKMVILSPIGQLINITWAPIGHSAQFRFKGRVRRCSGQTRPSLDNSDGATVSGAFEAGPNGEVHLAELDSIGEAIPQDC